MLEIIESNLSVIETDTVTAKIWTLKTGFWKKKFDIISETETRSYKLESLFDLSVIETEIARGWLGLNLQKRMLKIEERVFLVDNDSLSMLGFEPWFGHQTVYYLSVKETRSWKLERLKFKQQEKEDEN